METAKDERIAEHEIIAEKQKEEIGKLKKMINWF